MRNANYQHNQNPPSKRKRVFLVVVGLLVICIVAVAVWLTVFKKQAEAPQQAAQETGQNSDPFIQEPQPEPLPSLQPVIDEWAGATSGTASVYITDAKGNELASLNPDQQYFTASIYKLYVAYVGYQKIDNGTHKLSEPYLNGKTRGQCLDAMIRDSDSPCGEKMMAEFGQQALTTAMNDLGLKNTSLVGLTTSAKDAAIILQKIQNKKALSEQSKSSFLDSMKTQDSRYRRGLPSGFSEFTVFNKVGWNLTKEWHDTAIVQLPEDRVVVVSVLTENVGFRNIASLGANIEQKLTANP